VLAHGTTAASGTGWLALTLRCEGDRVLAKLNGNILAEPRDSTYPRGLVGITNCFHPARFDKLAVANPRID
jgi:hypothetical protein